MGAWSPKVKEPNTTFTRSTQLIMNAFQDITVRSVMAVEPFILGPEQPVQDALDLMNAHRVGAVLICDGDKLVGIFTERDFLRRATTAAPGWRQTPLTDWMSPNPYTISPEASWEDAVSSLERLRVRHLPVLEEGKVVGIVSGRQFMARRTEHLNQLVEARTRELRRVNDLLLLRDAEVNHYMKAAARLQRSIVLPHTPPNWEEFAWGIEFAPLDPLGGDFYDFAQPDDEHIGILIADASGHGIPAAMVAILASQAFNEVAHRTVEPREVLSTMNRRLQGLSDERYVTAFYGVLNRRTSVFRYANAGHPFPLHYSVRTECCSPLSARGFMLGIVEEEIYMERTLALERGDRLCFYTDGVPDCRDERGETFGTERLSAYLKAHGMHPVRKLTEGLVGHIGSFRGNERPSDDLTLLTVGVEK